MPVEQRKEMKGEWLRVSCVGKVLLPLLLLIFSGCGPDEGGGVQSTSPVGAGINQPPIVTPGEVSPVSPVSGSTATSFTFSATYKDPDGDPPAAGFPRVHILRGGVEVSGSPFAMTCLGGQPDFTRGAFCIHSLTLPSGTTYTFFFEASDGAATSTTGSLSGPTVTQASSLTSGGVSPPSGVTTTSFTYSVTYADPDGDPPAAGFPRVHILRGGGAITNSPFIMACSGSTFTTGVICSYPQLLGAKGSNYTFFFEASDGSAIVTSISQSGPTVGLAFKNPTPQADANFGASVGMGDLTDDGKPEIIVGAPGQNVGGNTAQGQALVFDGATGNLSSTLTHPVPQANATFGAAVSLGRTAVVGAPLQDVGGLTDRGQAFNFEDPVLILNPSPASLAQSGARFGAAVATTRNVVVGAPLQDVGANTDQGQVFVFERRKDTLLFSALTTPTAQANARFGAAVATSRDQSIVGSPGQNVGGQTAAGQVFVFDERAAGNLLLTLTPPSPQADSTFGTSVATNKEVAVVTPIRVVVGASGQNVGGQTAAGQVFIFDGTTGGAPLLTLNPPVPQANANFGAAVAVDISARAFGFPDPFSISVVVGAPLQDVGGNTDQGQVFVFDGVTGALLFTFDNPIAQANAKFGTSVSVERDQVGGVGVEGNLVIGAPFQDVGGTTDEGQVFVFSLP